MFSDNTLTPREATRLCALGTLTEGPLTYEVLAREIRGFISYIIGPSLEVLASSIELLKYEGLVSVIAIDDEREMLGITSKGRKEFHALITAGLRPSDSDLTKLVTALKLRFLNQLTYKEKKEQIILLDYAFNEQLARLTALHSQYTSEPGLFPLWLEHEITELKHKLRLLSKFQHKVDSDK